MQPGSRNIFLRHLLPQARLRAWQVRYVVVVRVRCIFLKTRVIQSGLIAQDQIHGSGMQVFDVCMGMCVGGEWVDGGSWAGSASIFRSCV